MIINILNKRIKIVTGAALLTAILSLSACMHSDKPQPVDLGKDECAGCGMTI